MEENNNDIDQNQKALVKRIAKLIEENKSLSSQVKELTIKNNDLSEQIDRLKNKLEKYKDGIDHSQEEKTTAVKFNMVTILFLDVQGFKTISDDSSSQELIDELDSINLEFDRISEKHKIAKIKTIGDTYMCAGGVPVKNITNPVDVVVAAFEMLNYFTARKAIYTANNKAFYEIKIGIHTGAVMANTSGKKKISYDLKGETVNIASRLMSAAQPGIINISIMTYELVKEYFSCEYYGKMPVKFQGNLEMYQVKRIKLAYSVNREGLVPNEIFKTKYLLRQFTDLQEIILEKLEKELPPYLYYHNVKHTIDFVTQAELIAWGEGVSDEDILLLKTAGLFHDIGQIQGSKDHEDRGAAFVFEYLPALGYSPEQIKKISELIMATKLPPKPNNLLEMIMCDSDLDYLGRSDFIPISNTLFEELKAQNIITDFNEWNKLQVKFLSNHHYFTKTGNTLREVNKQEQIERIKKLIV